MAYSGLMKLACYAGAAPCWTRSRFSRALPRFLFLPFPFRVNVALAFEREALARDLGGIGDDHEGLWVMVAHDGLDAADLGEADDGEKDAARFLGEATATVEVGDAAVDVLHDIGADFLRLTGDDDDGFLAVETGGDAVRELGDDVDGDERKEHLLERADECRAGDDEEVQHEDDGAHVDGIVFLHDGADDIEAARVGVDAEHHAEADAREHAAEDGVEDDIRADVPVHDEMREVEEDGEHDGTEDGIERIVAAKHTVSEVEDWQVVDEVLRADGQAREIVDDDGNAADATREEMRGNQEQIIAEARQERAEDDLRVAHDMARDRVRMNKGKQRNHHFLTKQGTPPSRTAE